MANRAKSIPELVLQTAPAPDDLLVTVDVSNSNATKKITVSKMLSGMSALVVVAAPPTTAKGAAGDLAGMVSSDSSYMYFCTGAYDGITSIWKRVSTTSWS